MRLMKYAATFVSVMRSRGLLDAIRRSKRLILRKLTGSRVYRVVFKRQKKTSKTVTGETRISILMPVYNTPPSVLMAAIESVRSQTYQNWELCICDDCSTNDATLSVLRRYKGSDPNIKITKSMSNLHIAGATNLAMEYATGDFVAFLDHDDTIEPNAIECIVDAVSHYNDADLLYTDEDKIEVDGTLVEPYHKPGWSPEHLHSVMYILHFFVIRKKLLLELGGLREEFSGAQDYDLALRATKIARRIVHIPKILYHWRKIPGSAAATVDAKPQALVNARLALESSVKEIAPAASVLDGLLPGTYRVQWPIPHDTAVTLIIPTKAQRANVLNRGNILFIRNLLESVVKKTTWKNYRILVVDNHNLSPDDCLYIENLGGRLIHYSYDSKFNFSKTMNFAFRYVDTEQIIMLNDDTEIISNDWIEALLSFSTRESVGAVGARLLYPNERVQHAGIAINKNCECTHVFYNLDKDEVGYGGYTHLIRNYLAVTGAAMATRMSLINRIGGLREEFGIDYNDVDFCLRLREQGYRSVYTPYAMLYHFENSSVKRSVANTTESALFKSLWCEKLASSSYFKLQDDSDSLTKRG